MLLLSWEALGSDCYICFLMIVLCIVLNVTIVKVSKIIIIVIFCGGMTVEVRTRIAGSLLISMPLSMGTLKIYVADICKMDLKTLPSQM